MARIKGPNGDDGQGGDTHLLALAKTVRTYSERWEPPIRDWPVLHSLLLKPPAYKGGKWLVVLKGDIETGHVVAFHKGTTALQAIAGALQRVFTGHVDWREETPWRERR